MIKHLVDLRDFCYVMLKKRWGEAYAEQGYAFRFIVFHCGYYIAFWTLIAILQYKAGIPVSPIVKDNFIIKVLCGFLAFLPYYFLMKYLLRRIESIPIDKNMSDEKYKLLMRKSILTLAIEFRLNGTHPLGLG
ncbi:hypothetical protein GXP67_09070 [Rhodocytophaga rosea]|uniref:Uncharacterized protein n=1 Tax=Rhodocytophaga rosea TaxID=2704465 RepID=A0A6C0GFR7_9BACT|nr:hypothetical protein [Rhodocytophaga rosea]QHT66797.1 hypothetical protein GXP67_09070 [Rhodocytophaga rosea]